MFRSVLVSHDGSRSIEGPLNWLKPLLGDTKAHVELFGRRDAPASSELNTDEHLQELAAQLKEAGAEVHVLGADYGDTPVSYNTRADLTTVDPPYHTDTGPRLGASRDTESGPIP